MASWVVVAGQVTVETNVGPGRARVDVHRGAVLPDDAPVEDVDRLLALGHIVAAADDPAAGEQAGDDGEVPDGTIAVVMAWVGADVGRARAALAAEQLKGAKARLTLVGDLERLIQA